MAVETPRPLPAPQTGLSLSPSPPPNVVSEHCVPYRSQINFSIPHKALSGSLAPNQGIIYPFVLQWCMSAAALTRGGLATHLLVPLQLKWKPPVGGPLDPQRVIRCSWTLAEWVTLWGFPASCLAPENLLSVLFLFPLSVSWRWGDNSQTVKWTPQNTFSNAKAVEDLLYKTTWPIIT